MALNVQKLADRLKKFEDGAKASEFAKLLWKPKEGPQTVRIVPYKFDPENYPYPIGLAATLRAEYDLMAETIENGLAVSWAYPLSA